MPARGSELRQRRHKRDTKQAKEEEAAALIEGILEALDEGGQMSSGPAEATPEQGDNDDVDSHVAGSSRGGSPAPSLGSRSERSGHSGAPRRRNSLGGGSDEGGGDDGDGADDSEYDDDDGPSSVYAELRKPFVVPPHLAAVPQQDDTLLLAAALGGFALALLVGAALPRLAGVPQRNIMISGLGGLLLYAIKLAFCGCCSRSSAHLSPVEHVTPAMVFTLTACVGTMLGGMIVSGGAVIVSARQFALA